MGLLQISYDVPEPSSPSLLGSRARDRRRARHHPAPALTSAGA
jgi:hypothetical protein